MPTSSGKVRRNLKSSSLRPFDMSMGPFDMYMSMGPFDMYMSMGPFDLSMEPFDMSMGPGIIRHEYGTI